MTDGFLIVSSPRITAGLEVHDGLIAEAPPVLRWMTGKPLDKMLPWLAAHDYRITNGRLTRPMPRKDGA